MFYFPYFQSLNQRGEVSLHPLCGNRRCLALTGVARTLRVKASIDRAIWMCKSPKQACLDSDVICVDLAPKSLTTENVAEAIGQLNVLLIFNLANRFNSHWD